MQLMPAFLIEGCLSIYLRSAVGYESYKDGTPVPMRPCLDIMKLYADLFKNETYFSNDLSVTNPRITESLKFFEHKGLFRVQGDSVIVVDKEGAIQLLDFFSNLIHPLIDTYLVTLIALSEMCGKNLVIKNKKLKKELHTCFKILH